jgi:hypothetical protein
MALGPVDLVEVDHLGLQALKTGVAGANNVIRRQARAFTNPGHAARGAGHLAGQRDLIAHAGAGLEPAADDGFRRTTGGLAGRHGIHLGRIEEIHAALHGAVHDAPGFSFVDLLAECHGAKTDGADAQIALPQSDGIHGKTGSGCSRSHASKFRA